MTPFSPLPVLAVGAWLKNAACLADARGTHWSAVHGDLRDPAACSALEASAQKLASQASEAVRAVAHDLHPDFYSTRLAQVLADEWQVNAIGVQHHHAHIAAVMAEHGLSGPVIGLALDGVGRGSDGTAWGGELLQVAPTGWQRLGHLWPLALPGGDVAAREPWRMLASVLYAMGRGTEISLRLAGNIEARSLRMTEDMLHKKLNCPLTTSAGRWFDAAAAALGLHLQQQNEAEAAIALQQQAALWLQSHPSLCADLPEGDAIHTDTGALDIRPLLERVIDWPAGSHRVPAAAAWFHLALARALADWAAHAAQRAGIDVVCLGGGCFMNDILTREVTRHLQSHRLRVLRPLENSCGDAGLALGQAWVVAQQLRVQSSISSESLSCV